MIKLSLDCLWNNDKLESKDWGIFAGVLWSEKCWFKSVLYAIMQRDKYLFPAMKGLCWIKELRNMWGLGKQVLRKLIFVWKVQKAFSGGQVKNFFSAYVCNELSSAKNHLKHYLKSHIWREINFQCLLERICANHA